MRKPTSFFSFNSLYLTWMLMVSVFFAECAVDTNKEVKGKKLFFDLRGYFEKESTQISPLWKFRKITMAASGEREERVIDSNKISKELDIFAALDINRPSWSDKYSVDSVFTEDSLLVNLVYLATNKELKTQEIRIVLDNGEVTKILINNHSATAISSTEQLLTYQPGFGYSIDSKQNVGFGDESRFYVEVQFVK